MNGRIYKVLSDGAESFVFLIDAAAPQIWNQIARFFDSDLAEGFAAGKINEAHEAPLLLPAPEKISGGRAINGKRSGKPRGRPKLAAKRATATKPRGEAGAAHRQAMIAMIQQHVAANRGSFPPLSQIAKVTGVPIGSVFAVLSKLEDEGLIVRDGERKRHWKSMPSRKSRAGQDVKPANQARRSAAAPEARRSADQAAIDAHIASHGVTRVPPAAVAPGTAALNSKFEHEPVVKGSLGTFPKKRQ